MPKILIVEDEAAIRRVLSKILKEENPSYEIFEAEDGKKGYNMVIDQEYDLIFSDIKMPGMDGMELLGAIRELRPEIPVVMISGHGDLELAVNAMRLGAFDYISKPPDLNRLLHTVRQALDKKELVVENKRLKKKVAQQFQMIGNSPALARIQEMIGKVAPTDARVLITGPNGSGKELVANALHSQSQRSSGPLVEVNCAAIPSELIESALFGHVRGAFTSAIKDKAGRFEAANGGTLFLDEIGDMSLPAQAKVLRALQEQKIQRVGSDKDIKVDVRVLAATNKNLLQEIAEGRFREDLYHRLAVILIDVPSLADRKEDIPLLVDYFAHKIAQEQGTSVKIFNKKSVQMLQLYPWTGNIRELRNVVERLIILGGEEITEQDVQAYAGKQ
ncbi:MAG: Fis family transcriptional regulator [Cryomorphaceae bacterium BACL21 MAG-121220-bin10]|jgi:two-component system, NtrC family, nitrogen regulation response regulator NtrX|nr:MAG: Fis family transcriptional regulator [Cryomorphaceae bacterium BACL21 MAG-121220-bin10]|tara:strand:- start:21954 stop:23120 length:1167 start_codon:yes stop_codon:yes gene_type:complete